MDAFAKAIYKGMNINLIRLRGIIGELRGIRLQLERIADSMDTKPDAMPEPIGKDDPRDADIRYTDTDVEYLKEFAQATGQKIPGIYDPNEERESE